MGEDGRKTVSFSIYWLSAINVFFQSIGFLFFVFLHLGRSMLDILQLLSVCKEKGIDVHAVKGNWSLNGTIESKIVMTIYAMAAEIERDLISQRTKEGLRAARAKGKMLGRPKGPGKSKLDKFRPEIEALLKDGSPKTFIAKRYGTTPANLYNWMKKNGIDVKADRSPVN